MEDQTTSPKKYQILTSCFHSLGAGGHNGLGCPATLYHRSIYISTGSWKKNRIIAWKYLQEDHTHTYIHTRINNDTIHTVYIYIQTIKWHHLTYPKTVATSQNIYVSETSWCLDIVFLEACGSLTRTAGLAEFNLEYLIQSARFSLTGMMKLLSHLSLAEYFGDNNYQCDTALEILIWDSKLIQTSNLFEQDLL